MNKVFLIIILYLSCINAKIDFSKYKEIETKECTVLVPKDLVLKEKDKNNTSYRFVENDNLKVLHFLKQEIFYENKKQDIKKFLKKYYLNNKEKKKFLEKKEDGLQLYGFKKHDWLNSNKEVHEFLIRGKYIIMILDIFSKKEAEEIFNYCIQTKIDE